MQDIATKVEGSQLTAEEFNQIPSELENVITSTGQELTSADVRQLAKALAIYVSRGDFYTTTGTANNIILYPIGNMLCPTSYSIGLKVRFIPTVNNSGNVTLSIKDLPVVNLYDNEGNNLSSGYLVANQVYTATFDGTNFKLSEIPMDLVRRLIDSKQDEIIGAATTITNNNLTKNKVVYSNNSGKIAASNITKNELDCLSGVTDNIQIQLNSKKYTPDYDNAVDLEKANGTALADGWLLVTIIGTTFSINGVTIQLGGAYNIYTQVPLLLLVKEGDRFSASNWGGVVIFKFMLNR